MDDNESMTWSELREWSRQTLGTRLPDTPKQSVSRVLDVARIGSGHDRSYGMRDRLRLYAHVVWFRIAGQPSPRSFAIVEQVRTEAAAWPDVSVFVLDGEVTVTAHPEAMIRAALTAPYGFAVLKPASTV